MRVSAQRPVDTRRASRNDVKTMLRAARKSAGGLRFISEIVRNIVDFVKHAFMIIPAGGERIVVAPYVLLLQREMRGYALVQVGEEALNRTARPARHPLVV